jgi:hypothetical protein
MVFAAAAATTTGRLAVSVASMRGHAVFGRRIPAHYAKPQRRAMGGGGHGHAPEWEGVDKVVRGVFPGDHHRTCWKSWIVFFHLLGVLVGITMGWCDLFPCTERQRADIVFCLQK